MEALIKLVELTVIGLGCGALVTGCFMILGFLATHPPVKKKMNFHFKK